MSASPSSPSAAAESQAGPAPDSGQRPPWVFLAILAIGIAVRLWHLGSQSLTMDEVTELELAARGVSGLIGADDGFPPLFSLLLHGWVALFGQATAHGLPALLGILALPAMYRLGREIGGEKVGRCGMLLLALSPIHVWYSQEIRAYGLFFLLVIVTLWRYAVARRSGARRDWLLYALAAGVGCYGHYYFALLIAGLVTLDLLEPGRPAIRVRRVLERQAPIVPVILPLVPLLIDDVLAQQAFPMQERPLNLHALGYTFFTYLAGFTLGPSLRELHTIRPGAAVRQVLPWAIPLALAAAWLLVAGWRDASRRHMWLAMAIIMAVPLLVCGVLGTLLDLSYRSRYVAWGAVPMLLLLALGAVGERRRWASVAALTVILAGSAVAIVNRQASGRYWNEDARGAARDIERLVTPGAPVFVVSGYMAGPLQRYLDPRWPVRAFSRAETVASPEPALEEIKRTLGPGRRFWLVYSRPFDGDPAGRLRETLTSVADLRLRASVPGFDLYEGTGW